MNVYVVTVATQNVGYLNILKESCVRYNFELVILGFGEKWGGFTWKFVKTRQQLDKYNDEDIVIFVDGYDTFILSDKDHIINNFLSLKTNILISIEKYDENRSLIQEYIHKKKYNGKCRGDDLNSGLYMGYVKYIKEFLDVLCSDKKCNVSADDQRLMVELCNSGNGFKSKEFFESNVKLDHELKIFYNSTRGVNNFRKSKFVHVQKEPGSETGLLINTKSGDRIGIVSGPGNSDLSGIIELYGFRSKYFNRSKSLYLMNSFLTFSKYFYSEIIALIFILIIIRLMMRK